MRDYMEKDRERTEKNGRYHSKMIEKDRKIISLDEAVADANEKSRNRLVDESYVEEVIQKVELVKKRFRQES